MSSIHPKYCEISIYCVSWIILNDNVYTIVDCLKLKVDLNRISNWVVQFGLYQNI